MWFKRLFITICLAVGFIVAGSLYFADTLSGEADEYSRLVQDLNELARKTEAIEDDCARLEAEKLALTSSNPEYLERVIWQQIRKVRPGDVVVRFED